MSRSETEVDSGRKEENILFLELNGELVGINLKNQSGTCNLECSSPPPIAPFCCRIPLHKNGYPLGMRHFKSPTDDKLYLLGGALFDPYRRRSPVSFDRYSDDVYEFKVDRVMGTTDNDTTVPFVLSPDAVLRRVNHPLRQPKFALVANLKGKIFALHHANGNDIPPRKPKNHKHTFEYFDPSDETWHDAPVPDFYLRHDKIDWPFWGIPRECLILSHFVVDSKLFLVCRDGLLHTYDSDKKTWVMETKKTISRSFAKFKDHSKPSIPDFGLWLSKFPDDDPNSLGVMLTIYLVVDNYAYGNIIIPYHHVHFGISHYYSCIYKTYAYSMSKTSGQPESCQVLDEVFSGMYHFPLRDVSRHLFDLGNDDAHGNRRRICAVMTGEDLDGYPYLLISIFNLQLRVNPENSSDFLEVSIIKKLLYRLNNEPQSYKKKEPPSIADDNNECWFATYDVPPLDAFIV